MSELPHTKPYYIPKTTSHRNIFEHRNDLSTTHKNQAHRESLRRIQKESRLETPPSLLRLRVPHTRIHGGLPPRIPRKARMPPMHPRRLGYTQCHRGQGDHGRNRSNPDYTQRGLHALNAKREGRRPNECTVEKLSTRMSAHEIKFVLIFNSKIRVVNITTYYS